MTYTRTKPNQLVATKKPCKSCGIPTLFASSVLPGMRICPECEPKVREAKVWHEAHERNKRSKAQTKSRGRRGSNQYVIRKRSKREDAILLALCVISLGIMIYLAIAGLLNYGAEASYVSPVATSSASLIESPSPTLTPAETGEKAFLRRVHIMESSAGKNTNPNALHNVCKAKGMSNEYGYGGMRLMICFKTHEEATARVAEWYREHRATRTETQTYCYYNLGLNLDTCEYWEKVRGLGL